MAKQNVELLAFNRGRVSPLALARTDIKRIALSAETQTNFIPRVLGPMSLRPGWKYLHATKSNAAAKQVPFIFAVNDTAVLELTSGVMRVRVNDALVSRVSVSTAITNGTFNADIAGWTDSDDAGATSQWATGGYMSLQGDGTAAAVRDQTVTVAAGDQNKEHAVRVTIYQGECYIRIGSTSGGDEYVNETFLYPGIHSLAFTPTGNFYIRVFSREAYPTLIDSIVVESAGTLEITTPWTTAAHLNNLRYDQSGDVIFLACEGVKPKRIERRSTTSWSVVDYTTDDGPFRPINGTPTTLTASALTGSVTLTASKPLFKATNVGSLFKIVSSGQNVTKAISAQNTFSDEIRVFGVGTDRAFTIVRSGTWTATVTLQRSIGVSGDWTDVTTYTTNATVSFNDALDNQVIYYRLGVKTGDYTSGTVDLRMSYPSGSIIGLARVTAYTSTTVVTASVLKALGSVSATADWYEGAWSDRRGYPSAVALHESRLCWAGKDKVWASVVDAFISFDEDFEGDAGPISRSIGSGPVDAVRWLKSGQRLMLGGQGKEYTCRSSSLDEPLTPTNFNLKPSSTRGSAGVDAVLVDNEIILVDRSGTRVYELSPDAYGNHTAVELSLLAPEIGNPSIVRMAVQRQPDTRIHFVRSDGTVAMLVYDKAEEVRGWIDIETDGDIEDVVVIPGDVEDNVYYVVARVINGSTVRYVEKWALISEAVGGSVNKQADAFYEYSGVATAIISGLSHLEAETVVVWAGGVDLGTFVVTAGAVTLPSAVTSAVIGLGYQARFKSTKLAYAAQAGSALTQTKRVDHLGMVLANTHAQGLRYGPDFTNMDELPQIEEGVQVDQDSIWSAYDKDSVEFNGEYDTDSRVCLEANAPRPCTVLGAVVSMQTYDKI